VNPNATYDDFTPSRRSFMDLLQEAATDANVRRFEYARGTSRVVIRK
jgi:hypothetical protein